MSAASLREAQKRFAIQDVLLCESNVWSSRRLALGAQVANPSVQFKIDPSNDCTVIHMPEQDPKLHVVNYFVGTGIRIFSGPVPTVEPTDGLVATVTATFLARYLVNDEPTTELLEAFNPNAIHHIWPYWREYVASVTTRLRVPTVIIPMKEIAQQSLPNTTDPTEEPDAE